MSNKLAISEEKFHVTARPNIQLEGIITVVLTNGKHYTYRIEPVKTGTLAGKTVLSLLTGPDNTNWRSYTSFAFVDADNTIQVWSRYRTEAYLKHAQLVAGGAEEHVAKWMQAGRCVDCGRLLTDPESIIRGRGEVCHEKNMQ